MSVSTLIQRHGTSIPVLRPTQSKTTLGSMARSYSVVNTLQGWIQPNNATDSTFSGRATAQTSGRVYFAGRPEILTDDLLQMSSFGGQYVHVTSVRIPIDRPEAGANCHTIVEFVSRFGESVPIVEV